MSGADASAWTQALADALLPDGISAGRPVRLNCDDEAVALAGTTHGIARAQAAPALVACLHAEGLVHREHGVRALARANAGPPPRYLLGLAVLVLAASRMASDETGSMAAYYRRLSELLHVPLQPNWPQIRGVPELVERFEDLATWMAGPEQGARGLLDLPDAVNPTVVGVPISQSLLRAGDRIYLGAFFERTSRLIDAGWDPVHQLARWSGRHHLSVPLQALLERPALHGALAGALRTARHNWDGATVDAGGRRLLPGQLTLHLPPGPIAIAITVPALGEPAEATGIDGQIMALDPLVPAAVPLSWLEHAAAGPVNAVAGDERVRVFPGPTTLFEITALGVQSVAAAADEPVWALTCDEDLIAACDEHQRLRAPLPPGWVLLCDVEPDLLADELRVHRDDDERPLGGVRALGGLRLADEVWLLDHPPQITADVPEPAPVSIDGAAHGDIEPDQTLTLEKIAHQEGVHHVEIGEQTLTIELAGGGPQDATGSLAFDLHPQRVNAGPTAAGAQAQPHLAGPLLTPAPADGRPRALIVRYRANVDVIDVDGSVRSLGPPTPAAWLDHVGLPQDGPWEIPAADRVVWLCVDVPGRRFIVAHQAVDVPLTDEVLSVVEWHADAQQIVDRSDGRAAERWERLTAALEEVA